MSLSDPATQALRVTDSKPQRHTAGLGLAIFLGIVFQALCFLRIGIDSRVMLPQQAVLRSVFDTPIWRSSLASHVVLFVIAHLLLAGAFGSACWLLARISLHAWPGAQLNRVKWIVAWIVLGGLWLIVANAAMYPWSSLGEPYAIAVRSECLGLTAFGAISFATAACLLATIVRAALKTFANKRHSAAPTIARAKPRALALLCLVATALAGIAVASIPRSYTPTPADRPNIFLIGIDSLRLDIALGKFEPGLAPNISAFLRESLTFTDAITPLARTFPSWTAMLTGREPQTTGAYINLLSPTVIHTGETLPQTLRKAGYSTQYAIDEVRFSNIDASYGFDRVATPRMGASDFILADLNDTPLSNMVLNSRVGAWLFPNSYANRAAAATYDPDTFVDRLRHEFTFDGPTFTAVHFTLPHWPYFWATAPAKPDDSLGDSPTQFHALYKNAVHRADQQFADLMAMLRQRGAFEKAIVIVMSDHGEAIGTVDDFPYSLEGAGARPLTTLGHGTSILSPHQYRVVLGVKFIGFDESMLTVAQQIDAPVSLIDLAPTVVDLLGLQAADPYDGVSLRALLQGQPVDAALRARIRFTQTEFNPRQFHPGRTLTASAVGAIAKYYQVDPDSDRITFRENLIPQVLRERQYGAIRGTEMLVALPNLDRSAFNLFMTHPGGGVLRRANAPDAAAQAVELRSALMNRFPVVAQYTAATQ